MLSISPQPIAVTSIGCLLRPDGESRICGDELMSMAWAILLSLVIVAALCGKSRPPTATASASSPSAQRLWRPLRSTYWPTKAVAAKADGSNRRATIGRRRTFVMHDENLANYERRSDHATAAAQVGLMQAVGSTPVLPESVPPGRSLEFCRGRCALTLS